MPVPLHGPGWDLFSYPVETSRTITQALTSIDGLYTTVYWYDGSDPLDPWKVYDVSAPAWVNDLSILQFGEAYWINLLQAITLRLKGNTSYAAVKVAERPVPPHCRTAV